MRGKIFLLSLVMMMFSIVSAQGLQASLKSLEAKLNELEAMIFEVEQGKFKKGKAYEKFRLESNHNYRIFVFLERNMERVETRLTLSDDRENLLPKEKFYNIPCYHWTFSTFRNTSGYVILQQPEHSPGQRYVVVIASRGKLTKPGFVRKRVVDTQENVYEIRDGVVYRNGREFYNKPSRYYIVSLCLKTNDTIFLRSRKGDVLRRSLVVYKTSKKRPGRRRRVIYKAPIVKMVASHDDKLYMISREGNIYDGRGRLVYKGNKESQAIDLVEEDNNVVWLIRRDGKRQQP